MQSNYNDIDQNLQNQTGFSGSNTTFNPLPSGTNPLQNQALKSKKTKLVMAGLFILFLVVALGATFILTQTGQDVRQQAQTPTYPGQCYPNGDGCPAGWEAANTIMCERCNPNNGICCVRIPDDGSIPCSARPRGGTAMFNEFGGLVLAPRVTTEGHVASVLGASTDDKLALIDPRIHTLMSFKANAQHTLICQTCGSFEICDGWYDDGCTQYAGGGCGPVCRLDCGRDASDNRIMSVKCVEGEDGCQFCGVCLNWEKCPAGVTPAITPGITPPPGSSPTPTPPPGSSPTPTPPPGSSPTPTPTPPPGSSPTPTPTQQYPQCLLIEMGQVDATGNRRTFPPESAQINQEVNFICSATDSTMNFWYEFRVAKRTEREFEELDNLGGINFDVSIPYTIKPGEYIAQCRVCSTGMTPNCVEWEPLIWPDQPVVPTATPTPGPIVCNPDGSVRMMSTPAGLETEIAVQSQTAYTNVELRIETTTDQTLVFRDPDLSGSYIWTWWVNIQPNQIETIYFFVNADPGNPGYGGTCIGML